MKSNQIGMVDGFFRPCPNRPNCVSSDSNHTASHIDPLRITSNPEAAWRALLEAVVSIPRTTVISSTPDYLHLEARSRLFGFVDDVEFHLRSAEGIIAVRSASRSGYSDLGVNRKRIERIRSRLAEKGHVE